jgi:hypothetical protein
LIGYQDLKILKIVSEKTKILKIAPFSFVDRVLGLHKLFGNTIRM